MLPLTDTYLNEKNPKEQKCDVPCEEEEGGTDPDVVEQGEVQQPSYTIKGVGRAGKVHTHPVFYTRPVSRQAPSICGELYIWYTTNLSKWRFSVLQIHAFGMYPGDIKIKYLALQ